MKKTGLILLLALAIPLLGWSQASHKAVVNSQGGGATSSVGAYSHFGVVGQQIQTVTVGEFGQNQDPAKQVTLSVGFLQAAAANVMVAPPCLVPFGVSLSALGETTATINWSVEAGATYEFRYKELASANFVETTPQTPNASLVGLTPGTDYIWQLRKLCAEDEYTDWTEELRFKTLGNPPCEAPGTVTVAVDGLSATINWSASATNPQGYVFRYRSTSNTDWITDNTQSLNQSYALEGLAPGIYQVQVGVNCLNVPNTVFSPAILFQVVNPCAAPALSLEAATVSSLHVSWPVASNTTGFNLRIRPKGSFTWSSIVAVTGATHTFEGLEDDKFYEIAIQAQCTNGTSTFSNIPFEAKTRSLIADCIAPKLPTVANIEQSEVGISWPATNALYYELQYREKGTVGWTTVQTFNATLSLNNLVPGKTYVAEVKSVCKFGSVGTAFSPRVEFTTLPPLTACEVPSNVQVTRDGTTATFTWENEGAVAYELWYRRSNSTVWNTRVLTEKTIVVTGLTEGATNVYQIRSLCGPTGEIRSNWTPQATFVVPSTFICNAPGGLAATTGNEGEINLTWSTVAGASNYRVRYKVKGFSFWSSTTVSGLTGILQGLEPGIAYEVAVATVCSADNSVISAYSPIILVVSGGTSTCNVPINLSTTPGNGSVVISWSGGGPEYLIRYKLLGTTQWTFEELTSTTFTSNTLQAGMTYQYQVRSVCSTTLLSDYTILAEFTTGGAPTCDVPLLSATASPTNNSIGVSWSGAAGAVGYNLQFRLESTNVWTSRQVTGANFTASGLQPGTAYQFRVQSICDEDGLLKSSYSAIRQFSTSGTANCSLPTAIAEQVTASTATVSWTPASGGQYYQLRYRRAGSASWTLSSTLGNSSEVTISGLLAGTTYQYQVRTVCDGINFQASAYSAEFQFTTTGEPCLVPVPSIEGNPSISTTITWVLPEGSAVVAEYEYQYRVNGALSWETYATANTTATLTGLFSGETYQFRVRSICDAGSGFGSVYSPILFIAIPGESSCVSPSGLTVANITTTSALLTWGDGGFATYDIQYRKEGQQTWTTQLNIANTQWPLTGLAINTEYEWRVRSDCQSGSSSVFSNVVKFTTLTDQEPAGDGDSGTRLGSEVAQGGVPKASDIDKLTLAELKVEAYPNPFMDWLTIKVANPTTAQVGITLFNMAGSRLQDIFQGQLESDTEYEFRVDGTMLGRGVYLIVINGEGNQRIVKKVIR